MEGLAFAVLVGVALLAGSAVAARLRLPAPLVLLALGVVLGWVLPLRQMMLSPEVVLFLFLPALLYWDSLSISTREARRNLRVIVLSAIPLVIITAAVVALAGTAWGFTIPVAVALGAIVAPTDATAVGPITGRLPRRARTVLRSESLLNDGTALTILVIAITAIEHQRQIDFGVGALLFVAAYAGGIAVGIAVAWLVSMARRLLRGQLLLESGLSVLTPFLAFLPAQLLGVSGVVAVVTTGVILSHFGARAMSARTRVQTRGFWQLASGLVNGALFLLVGLQAHRIVAALGGGTWRVLGFGVLIGLLVIAVRLVWVNTTPYLIRALDRRPVQRTMRVSARQRLVSGWAGFRGAVSLAAALSLPSDPSILPRDVKAQVLAVTLVVIVVTLVIQGLTMPAVVRFARLPEDPSEREEELLAEQAMREAGERGIERAAEHLGTPQNVVDAVRRQYEDLHRADPDGDPRPSWSRGSEGDLRRALIAKKREAVIRLRDGGRIDDTVLQRMQDRLDIEELRLSPVEADD